jgi:hypothetical protein
MAKGLDDPRTTAELVFDRTGPCRVTPQVRSDARNELVELDRLRDVVVGPGAETRDEGVLEAFTGQQDDGQGCRMRSLAERANHVCAGYARQAHVEDDKADGFALDDAERGLAAGRLDDVEACAPEADRKQRARRGVVIDDEDRSFRGG